MGGGGGGANFACGLPSPVKGGGFFLVFFSCKGVLVCWCFMISHDGCMLLLRRCVFVVSRASSFARLALCVDQVRGNIYGLYQG